MCCFNSPTGHKKLHRVHWEIWSGGWNLPLIWDFLQYSETAVRRQLPVIIMLKYLSLNLYVITSSVCRHEFDSEHVPDLTKDAYVQDIHSVGSLCKLYFRELPNPLLTYQLYEKFSVSISKQWHTSDLIVSILEVTFWRVCHRMLCQPPLMRRGWSKSMMSYSSCLHHTTG